MSERARSPANRVLRMLRVRVLAIGILLAAAALIYGRLAVATTQQAGLRPVFATAMDYAIRTAPPASRHCVRLDIPNDTFERWREYQKVKGELELGLADPAEYDWKWIGPEDGKGPKALASAVQQAVSVSGDRRQRVVPATWVPRPLEPTEDPAASRTCTVHIFSDPIFVGDWAFVEDDVSCGPLCGAGRTLAMKRVNGNWSVMATASTWHVGFERMLADPVPDPSSNAFADF